MPPVARSRSTSQATLDVSARTVKTMCRRCPPGECPPIRVRAATDSVQPAMLREIARLRYREAEVSAGAMACDSVRLVIGTYSGCAAFDLGSLTRIWNVPDLLPPKCNITGVQLDQDDVILLGHMRSRSFAVPGDWGACLLAGRIGSDVHLLRSLPPGSWCMVRRVVGKRVFLYDVSGSQGISAYEEGRLVWSASVPDARKIFPFGEHLLALGTERAWLLSRDGEVLRERALPALPRYSWTTAVEHRPGGLCLGGYDRRTKAFAVGYFDELGDPEPHITEHALDRVFSAARIERAMDDEGCGMDIHHIARMEMLSSSTMLVALGGEGEGLGACHSASALGLIRVDAPGVPWVTRLVDEHDGTSGLWLLPGARVVVDFCGDIRIYALPESVGAADAVAPISR